MNLILFDIDGTILKMKDSISKKLFSENLDLLFGDIIDEDKLPAFHGMTDLQIIYDIADSFNFPKSLIESRLPAFFDTLSETIQANCNENTIDLMPGIPELLNKIEEEDRICLALLTGNIRNNAYSKLSAYSVDCYFPIGAFGDDHADRSELVKIALHRASDYYGIAFHSRNSIIIGDSINDIKCARTNNIPVLSVATGALDVHELSYYKPDYLLNDLSQVDLVLTTIKNHFGVLDEENNYSN
jgi:phosphoglycolate phosphatase-like HAD superfamily hydrolase